MQSERSKKMNEAFSSIAKALEDLDVQDQRRVVRAVCVILDIPEAPEGPKPAPAEPP
jgi:hypothetical protein